MWCSVQYARPSFHSNIFCVLKYKQDGVFDKNRMLDNVQKHNICMMYYKWSCLFQDTVSELAGNEKSRK
jgi:hypothetical protein